jgi:hypothetical protein
MFASAAKYMQESAEKLKESTAAPMAQAKNMIASVQGPSSYVCFSCGTDIGLVTMYGSVLRYNKCAICTKLCCKKCIGKSAIPVPDSLLNVEFKAVIQEGKVPPNDVAHYLCFKTCTSLLFDDALKKFRTLMRETYEPVLTRYLAEPTRMISYTIPADSEDSTKRKAIRFLLIAEYAADISGICVPPTLFSV